MNEHNEVANIVADAMEVFIKNNLHKPMTNYDRIKSMSVEEQAKTITMLLYKVKDYTNAEHYIKQWLLQEVSEDE